MKYDPDATYHILVKYAGAPDDAMDRRAFAVAHRNGCEEYRFMGRLGFGGKYRSKTNTVDCYPEDMTPERRTIIDATNAALNGVTHA